MSGQSAGGTVPAQASRLSAADITRSFLNVEAGPGVEPRAMRDGSLQLTATARYLVRESRKLLGQQQCEGAGPAPSEEMLLELVRHIELRDNEQLSERERAEVVSALNASSDQYSVLSPLIADADVNDVIVRAYNDVSVQKNRENLQTTIQFSDADSYRAFVEQLLKRAGKSCTLGTPVVDVAVDTYVRACVTHESFSPPGSGPMLTLRISRHRSISLGGLALAGLAPALLLDYLRVLVVSGEVTLLLAGEVGTGKTTLVKALAHEIPASQAILVIEDTHELSLSRSFVRTLLTREANSEGAGRIAPAQAIRTGMRMAMNRLILGEMRDAEAAEAFIDVCSSGHAGMSTIHARSARDALARLELFLARAQGNVSDTTIRRQIANALSIVVHLGVHPGTQERVIQEIVEIGSSSDGPIQITPVFRCVPDGADEGGPPVWRRESSTSHFRELLRREGVILPGVGEFIRLSGERSRAAEAV